MKFETDKKICEMTTKRKHWICREGRVTIHAAQQNKNNFYKIVTYSKIIENLFGGEYFLPILSVTCFIKKQSFVLFVDFFLILG